MSRTLMVVLGLAAVVIVAGGCETSTGVVASASGSCTTAPDLTYRLPNGQMWSLSDNRGPLVLIAFSQTAGCDCGTADPRIVALAQRYCDLPVSVVQITALSGQCVYSRQWNGASAIPKMQMKSLCDPDRVAWKAYGCPAGDAVFLIDECNQIVATGTLGNMCNVDIQVRALGRRIQQEWEPSGD